ncbi:MAG: thioesterase family protein [Ignavibacteria bacterium]|nr:MAG: thioesterase family protein [Ignavibacteria bacterium]
MDELSLYKHKLNITVRFSDLDAMGHVNNATFLTFLEEARFAYFRAVIKRDRDYLKFEAIIARIEIDYKNQICLNDKVVVFTRCPRIGVKSADIENLIVVKKETENKIAAFALSKLVTFDYKRAVSIPINDYVRKALVDYEEM